MLHPLLQSISDQASRSDLPPLRTVGPSAARERIAALKRSAPPTPGGVRVEDGVIEGVRVRTYTPEKPASAATVVHLHSGGWVLGDLDAPGPMLSMLARASGLRIIDVDYRLAPEHPYPAALEDVGAIVDHLIAEGTPFLLHGDSSGGNLAAVAAARYRGNPLLLMQVLVYPVTDADFTRPSYRGDLPAGFLEPEDMKWFWGLYAGEADVRDETLSPLRGDLAGLPCTVVVTAGFDPLKDEGAAYAQKAAAAGVDVTFWHVPDCTHGFLQMVGVLDRADQIVQRLAAEMRRIGDSVEAGANK